MFSLSAKKILAITSISLGTLVIVVWILWTKKEVPQPTVPPVVEKEVTATPKVEVIGTSVEGRKIESYSYGVGATHLVFVGGIHGGYEWNSVLVAYQLMDYLKANPTVVPKNLTITVVPSANPDAIFKVTNKEGRFASKDVSTDKIVLTNARFNAHEVDLNRNFDCKWKPKSTWQTKIVSAGTAPFSEPEAQAIRNLMIKQHPIAAVFWHSQANGVFASQCEAGILLETLSVMNVYAKASGYPAIKTFNAYQTTGASEDWLASINIPAITVELKTHETVEWEQNLAGIKALITYYGK